MPRLPSGVRKVALLLPEESGVFRGLYENIQRQIVMDASAPVASATRPVAKAWRPRWIATEPK